MKKILLTICACIMLAISFTGCGIKASQKLTLEDFYNKSEDVRKAFDDDAAEMLRAQDCPFSDVSYTVVGNELDAIYTLKNKMPIEYKPMFEAALGNQLVIKSQSQVNTLRLHTSHLSDDPIIMKTIVKNPDGAIFYEYTYTEPTE